MPLGTYDDSEQEKMNEQEKAAKEARIAAHKEKWLKHFYDLETRIKVEIEDGSASVSQQRQQTTTNSDPLQLTSPATDAGFLIECAPPTDQIPPVFASGESPAATDPRAVVSADISSVSQPAKSPTPQPKPNTLSVSSNGADIASTDVLNEKVTSHSSEKATTSQAKKLSGDNTKKRLRVQSPTRGSQQSAPGYSPLSGSSTGTHAQKKSKIDTPAKASSKSATVLPSLEHRNRPVTPPEWYLNINMERIKLKNRDTYVRLTRVTDLIHAAKMVRKGSNEIFDKIRDEIHELEFISVSGDLLRKVGLLDNQRGIPQLFHPDFKESLQVPWDIQSDTRELYYRWAERIFKPDLLRGIEAQPRTVNKSIEKKGWSLDPKYERTNALYFGNGALVNGQWWPRQICAVRDGAHGAMIAGITGIKNEGAVSVVMSGAEYNDSDVDNGEDVWYCGTASNDPSGPTEATNLLILSLENKKPVRLMRSSNILNSQFKPSHGFRYDGLYDVVEKELISNIKQHYRFHLVRQRGQTPIRYKRPEARPTPQEIEALQKLERDLGMKGWSD